MPTPEEIIKEQRNSIDEMSRDKSGWEITHLLELLEKNTLYPKNISAFVKCATTFYEYALKLQAKENNDPYAGSQLAQGLRSLVSKKYQAYFLQAAQQYDTTILRAVLKEDKYCLFSRTLLEDKEITAKLGEQDLEFARQQLHLHLEAIQNNPDNIALLQTLRAQKTLNIGLDPIANFVAVNRLKKITPNQKFYDSWSARDWWGYRGSHPFDHIAELTSGNGNKSILYLGRQPTQKILSALKQPTLLLTIQGRDEGHNDDGTTKIIKGSPLVTAATRMPGVSRSFLPIMDHSMRDCRTGTTITPQSILEFLAGVISELDQPKMLAGSTQRYTSVYVHCRGGKVRSALITALLIAQRDQTLTEAFDLVSTQRSVAKKFEKLNGEQRDVTVRTYFCSLAQKDSPQLIKLATKDASVIAKNLKWYLENANLKTLDSKNSPTTSNDNFWKVIGSFAHDENKFSQVLQELLNSLNEKGLENLMTAIRLPQTAPAAPASDSFVAIKAKVLIQVQATLQEKLSKKKSPKTLSKLLGSFFDTAVNFFKLEPDMEVTKARREVFLAHPKTLVKKVETQTKGVATQQIKLALGSLIEKPQATTVSADATMKNAPVRSDSDAVAAALAKMDEAGDAIVASTYSLMLASVKKDSLVSTQDTTMALNKFKEHPDLALLVKDKKHIYRAYLENGGIKVTPFKSPHHAALAKLFPEHPGEIRKHSTLDSVTISREILRSN